MSLQSDAMNESALQPIAPATISATRRMYWSVRREVWENRSIYIAPLAASALFLLGFLFSLIRLPQRMSAAATLDPMHHRAAIAMPYDIVAGLAMLIAMLVGVFYCLDALYGERRDRSILFWKSLPVSNLTTVLAKVSIPIVILPVFAFAVAVVTQFIMLLLSSARLAGSGQSVAALWNELLFPRMSLLLLYHLMTVHSLWIAPFYGWLLLVSAWARRAPFVWAFVPPVALCYLEKIANNTTHLTKLLVTRLAGNGMEAVMVSGSFPTHPMTQLTPGKFLASPGLWVGLAITAAFLAAAVRLRRDRGPI
jgi:ABC-2 type transport system permease protein